MNNQKTFYPKKDDVSRNWVEVDAEGQVLGRLASEVAAILRGKNKPEFTPSVDTGDFVVVVNADKVIVKGKSKPIQKKYYRHSGYPGGLKEKTLKTLLAENPVRVVEQAVFGMLPHNKLGSKLQRKLNVYAGPEHPHTAQIPKNNVTKGE